MSCLNHAKYVQEYLKPWISFDKSSAGLELYEARCGFMSLSIVMASLGGYVRLHR